MRERECDKRGLVDLIRHTGLDNINMIEIGSFEGESAEIFLKTGRVKCITCIDPWTTVMSDDGGNSYSNMGEKEKAFDTRMAQFGNFVRKFKGTIDEYVQSADSQTEPVDLVYIDGLHTYAGCTNDIRKTLEFIHPAYISGHDYADFPVHVQGVKKAVNEIFGKPDITFCDTSWLKKLTDTDN